MFIFLFEPSPVALPKPKRVCFQEKDSFQKKRIHAESSGLRVRIREKISRLIVSKKRKLSALSKKVIDSSRPKKRTRLQDRMVAGLSNLANKQKDGEFNVTIIEKITHYNSTYHLKRL